MSENQVLNGFIDKIDEAIHGFKRVDGFYAVLTHYDADGLTAGGLFIRFLETIGREFLARATTDLSDEVARKFFSIEADKYVLLDMGSGDLDRISKFLRGKEVTIIDHHKVSGDITEGVEIVNPELYGFDGGQTGCAGVLTGLLGYKATGDPYFLATGLVGAAGDMQLHSPVDVTKYLLNLAVENKVARVERGFIFFMNRSLPLHKAITWSFNPYIPEFSGRDDIGLMLIKKAGIEYSASSPNKRVGDLNPIERNRLLEEIVKYITGLGVDNLRPQDLTREYVILTREENPILQNADEFANLVNTAGRMGMEYLGILLTYGVRGELVDKLVDLYMERRKMIARFLGIADKRSKLYRDKIVVVDMRGTDFNYRFSGTISTILSRSIKYSDKVVILLSESPHGIKLSARAPKSLVERGLNLAEAMRSLSKKFSGIGGGHNVAAGATLGKGGSSLIDEIVDAISSELS